MPIDYKKYPSNWKTQIRPDILERAGNKCEKCGAPNEAIIYRSEVGWKLAPEGHQADAMALDGIKFIKIVLTIAHLDHIITHNEYENLAALCQKCHLNHDKYQHWQTREKKKSLMLEL